MSWVPPPLSAELHLSNFGLDHDRPADFHRCQWQSAGSGVSVWYLLYRWGLACYLVLTLAACIGNVGRRDDPDARPSKWPIYLTNWGYSLCTTQALLGAAVVTRTFVAQRTQDTAKAPPSSLGPVLRLYWVLHTTAVVIAFAITGSFWVAVFDPARHELDSLTVISHVGNSLAMGLDLLLVRHPLRLLHFPWPVGFLALYFLFSIAYFLAGGTDTDGMTYVYRILDWRRPLPTGVVCVTAMTYVVSAHLTTWLVFVARRGVALALAPPSENAVRTTMFMEDTAASVAVCLEDEAT